MSGRSRKLLIAGALTAAMLGGAGFGLSRSGWRPGLRTALRSAWRSMWLADQPPDSTPWYRSETYNLWDIGAVDINGDGILDVFTTNHNAISALLIGDGSGRFNEAAGTRIDHDPQFPGYGDSMVEPVLDAPGLYIYWLQRRLVLRRHGGPEGPGLGGTIVLDGDVTVDSPTDGAAEVERGEDRSVVRFELARGRRLTLAPPINDTPVHVALRAGGPVEVFLGSQRIPRAGREFDLPRLRDRHGAAFADFDGDGRLDCHLTRSGPAPTIEGFRRAYDQHLLAGSDGGFRDVTRASGLSGSACRAHESAWVDFDRDGSLELYVSCNDDAHRLYRRHGAAFRDIAGEVGLVPREAGRSDRGINSFARWFDADGDGDADLLHWTKGGIDLYRNLGQRFERREVAASPTQSFGNISIADFDVDGDTDVFLASWDGNRLLRNDGGTLAVVRPEPLGLPARSFHAAWVDYDNDGAVDLFAVPGGLSLQAPGGRFAAGPRGLLQVDPGTQTALSPVAGFLDVDNDGDRDLLYARLLVANRLIPDPDRAGEFFESAYGERLGARNPPFPFIWTWDVVINRRADGHWIAVDLVGDRTNRQAIGASVRIRGQLLQVGESDTSRSSQGHYRLYKGLGRDGRPVDIEITWPDGSKETRNGVEADRLVRLTWGREDRS